MKPHISIIIPTLNEEKYLPRLLRGIKRQTYTDFEVIIIDGSSKDGTVAVARSFHSFPMQIRTIADSNVSLQRNRGAQIAKGDYLVFLDADSTIRPTFLSKLAQYQAKNNGIVFIPSIYPNDSSYSFDRLSVQFVNAIVHYSQYTSRPFSNGGNIIIERTFFHMIGGFKEQVKMSEDHALVQAANSWGVRAKFLDTVHVGISFRRMKREGRIQLYLKFITAVLYLLIKGDMKSHVFSYEMGGGMYLKSKKHSLTSYTKRYGTKQIIRNIRNLFQI